MQNPMSTDGDSIDALLRAVAEAPPVPITNLVGGRFVLHRRLGQGTFGVVYEAEDRATRRRVALKLLRQPHPDWIHRFKREFRALRDLHHRNLIAFDELFCIDDRWFFTMELLDGQDLLRYTRSARGSQPDPLIGPGPAIPHAQAPAPASDVLRVRGALHQLCAGLAVFHDTGRVHRDIKPSNVLVTRDHRVVLLDFGLATEGAAHHPFAVSAVVGTPVYMAPEQAAGQAVSPAADLYSIGVLMYEMLTGRRPATRGPQPLVPGVPRDLEDLCLELLHADPARRPTAPQVRDRLGEAPARTAGPRRSGRSAGFIGRDRELAVLTDAFRATRQGTPSVCILHGESGIGKSRTVRQFIDERSRDDPGLVVLRGQCHEREAVPYKTIDGVLDALVNFLRGLSDVEVAAVMPTRAGLLGQVFPSLLRIPAVAHHVVRAIHEALPDSRTRAFRELRDLLTRLALTRPVVIAIDDLQWADADGLRALAEVMRPPDGPPLLVVGTLRTSAARDRSRLDELGTLLSMRVIDVPVGVLPLDSGRQLAAQLASGRMVDATELERIAVESGGHPLFIERLVDNLGEHPAAEPRLDDAIWAGVTALDAAQRRLSEVIALAGKPISLATAATAARIEGVELVPTLTRLCLSRIAQRVNDDRVDIYHGRIRDAVHAHIEPGQRRNLHAQLATAYAAEAQHDCEAIAVHWQEAGEPAHALGFLVRAGDAAAGMLAFDRAAGWYEQAIAIAGDQPALLRDLQCKLGDALANAGRGALAAAQFRAAARASEPVAAIVLRRREADQLLRSGHLARGLEVTVEILKTIGIAVPRSRAGLILGILRYRAWLAIRGFRFRQHAPDRLPPSALARLDICLMAAHALSVTDPLLGILLHTRGLLAALQLGEPDRLCRALSLELGYIGAFGQRAQRRWTRLFARAQAIARSITDDHPFLLASNATSRFLNGSFDASLHYSDRSIESMRRRAPGLIHEIVTMEFFSINALAELGRFAELKQRQQSGLRDAIGRGDVYAQILFSTGLPCIGWLISDSPDDAEAAIDRAMQAWPTRPVHLQHLYALSSRVLVSLYRGDPSTAMALAEAYFAAASSSLFKRIQKIRVAMYYYRGCAALLSLAHRHGSAGQHQDCIRACVRALMSENTEWVQGFAHQLRGGLLFHAGPVDAAIGELQRAIAAFERWEMMGYAMATRERLARRLTGEAAAAMHARAIAFFQGQHAASPSNMIAMLAPCTAVA